MAKATAEPKNDAQSRRQQCEALLRSLAETGRFPSGDELFELRSYGLGDTQELKREISRISRGLKLKSIGGTVADRQAMAEHAMRAAGLLESEGPEIQKKIDQLSKELRRLEADARLSTKRLEEMNNASKALRECLPTSSKRDFQQRSCQVTQTLEVPLQRTEGRIAELTHLLNPPTEQQAKVFWIESWQRHSPDCVEVHNEAGRHWKTLTDQHSIERLSLQSELNGLLAIVDGQRDELKMAVDTLEAELTQECENAW